MMIFSLVAMTGLEKCCITSAYLQWLCGPVGLLFIVHVDCDSQEFRLHKIMILRFYNNTDKVPFKILAR